MILKSLATRSHSALVRALFITRPLLVGARPRLSLAFTGVPPQEAQQQPVSLPAHYNDPFKSMYKTSQFGLAYIVEKYMRSVNFSINAAFNLAALVYDPAGLKHGLFEIVCSNKERYFEIVNACGKVYDYCDIQEIKRRTATVDTGGCYCPPLCGSGTDERQTLQVNFDKHPRPICITVLSLLLLLRELGIIPLPTLVTYKGQERRPTAESVISSAASTVKSSAISPWAVLSSMIRRALHPSTSISPGGPLTSLASVPVQPDGSSLDDRPAKDYSSLYWEHDKLSFHLHSEILWRLGKQSVRDTFLLALEVYREQKRLQHLSPQETLQDIIQADLSFESLLSEVCEARGVSSVDTVRKEIADICAHLPDQSKNTPGPTVDSRAYSAERMAAIIIAFRIVKARGLMSLSLYIKGGDPWIDETIY
ncbi:hypothetical protein IAR50_002956 [Cryptococcus sp. DSM 104548]